MDLPMAFQMPRLWQLQIKVCWAVQTYLLAAVELVAGVVLQKFNLEYPEYEKSC
jgi:hypothetical protein